MRPGSSVSDDALPPARRAGPTSTCPTARVIEIDEHPESRPLLKIQRRFVARVPQRLVPLARLHQAVRRRVRRLAAAAASRPARVTRCCCSQAIRAHCSHGCASSRKTRPCTRTAAAAPVTCRHDAASDVLLNTPDIEVWPAGLLRARSNHDARLLARAQHVLRRKRDGRYLAVDLPEGLVPLLPAFASEPGMDVARAHATPIASSARTGDRCGRPAAPDAPAPSPGSAGPGRRVRRTKRPAARRRTGVAGFRRVRSLSTPCCGCIRGRRARGRTCMATRCATAWCSRRSPDIAATITNSESSSASSPADWRSTRSSPSMRRPATANITPVAHSTSARRTSQRPKNRSNARRRSHGCATTRPAMDS